MLRQKQMVDNTGGACDFKIFTDVWSPVNRNQPYISLRCVPVVALHLNPNGKKTGEERELASQVFCHGTLPFDHEFGRAQRDPGANELQWKRVAALGGRFL